MALSQSQTLSDAFRFIYLRNAESPDDSAKELQVLRDGKVLSFSVLSGEIGVLLQNRGIQSITRPTEDAKNAPN